MARYRGQKSLYEVMNRARIKSSRSSTEPLHGETSGKAGQETPPGMPKPTRPVEVARYRRPAPIQINEGRIELTVPVKVAALLGLAVIVCLLLAFRFGQLYSTTEDHSLIENQSTSQPQEVEKPSDPSLEPEVEDTTTETETTIPAPPPLTPAVTDTLRLGNAIVIQEFDKKADLKAVGTYFDQEGIPTEIVRKGQSYFLITQERFAAGELGTKGYVRRQEIKNIGKNYKAPQGLEPFSTHFFSDAYSMKIDEDFIKEK